MAKLNTPKRVALSDGRSFPRAMKEFQDLNYY